jgi:uncharacterized membrane protein YhaH (DUF805 family)
MDFKTLFSFHGRIGRGEWWGISIVAAVVSVVAYLVFSSEAPAVVIVLAALVYLVLLVISLATSVKRWHDRDKSGWWILINLVPIIGGLWSLIEQGFLAGTEGENRFGAEASGSAFDT